MEFHIIGIKNSRISVETALLHGVGGEREPDERLSSSTRLGGYLSIALPILVVPLAGNHSQVRAGNCTHVGDGVEATVYIGKGLVERYVEHGELVVVAKEALQEGLTAECELGKVVVRAVNEYDVGAVRHFEGSKIVVGADDIEQVLAIAHSERLHVVVGAEECGERRQIRYNHVADIVIVEIEVLEAGNAREGETGKFVVAGIEVLEGGAVGNREGFEVIALAVEGFECGRRLEVESAEQVGSDVDALDGGGVGECELGDAVVVELYFGERGATVEVHFLESVARSVEFFESGIAFHGNGSDFIAGNIHFGKGGEVAEVENAAEVFAFPFDSSYILADNGNTFPGRGVFDVCNLQGFGIGSCFCSGLSQKVLELFEFALVYLSEGCCATKSDSEDECDFFHDNYYLVLESLLFSF